MFGGWGRIFFCLVVNKILMATAMKMKMDSKKMRVREKIERHSFMQMKSILNNKKWKAKNILDAVEGRIEINKKIFV